MNTKNFVVLATLTLGAVASHAAAIDVSTIVADIAAQVAPIVLIGGAVLTVHLAIKAFKWVRAAMA